MIFKYVILMDSDLPCWWRCELISFLSNIWPREKLGIRKVYNLERRDVLEVLTQPPLTNPSSYCKWLKSVIRKHWELNPPIRSKIWVVQFYKDDIFNCPSSRLTILLDISLRLRLERWLRNIYSTMPVDMWVRNTYIFYSRIFLNWYCRIKLIIGVVFVYKALSIFVGSVVEDLKNVLVFRFGLLSPADSKINILNLIYYRGLVLCKMRGKLAHFRAFSWVSPFHTWLLELAVLIILLYSTHGAHGRKLSVMITIKI